MLLFALLGCSPLGAWDSGDPSDPLLPGQRIAASPGILDFGVVSANDPTVTLGTLTLYNLGDEPVTITGHDEPMGSETFVVSAPPILLLDAGFSIDLAVRYHPTTDQLDEAELLIEPGSETVRLRGTGTAPVLQVGASDVDPVVLGCTGAGTVEVANTGSESLTIEAEIVGSGEYTVTSAPHTLDPDEVGTITLSFSPEGGGLRGASLVLTSNDPLAPGFGVALSGLGYEGERVEESFRYAPSNPTDILFVIDTGGAMYTQLPKAEIAIPAFVDAVRDANVDYHLAALSGAGPCPASTPGWVDRTDTSLQAQASLEQGMSGASGAWDDTLLDLVEASLTAADSGVCLSGFRRPEADLHVIVITDGPSTTNAETTAARIEAAIRPAALYASALVPTSGTCGEPAPSYAAVVTGQGGTLSDLCDQDWTDAFTSFADLPMGEEAVRYPLAEAPVPSTISVRAEGIVFTAWTFDADANAVVFDGDQVPALGAEIVVEYVSSVSCG